MKKNKTILTVLSVLFIAALFSALTVSAFSEGTENLGDVIGGGKNPLMNPEYIDGGLGFGSADSLKESSPSLFVYNEDDEDQPKYCMNIGEMGPYWAEWKYDKAYSINRIIFQTGNDSAASPRRMGDGYTISGSNDGSSWDVIYTGKEMDTDATNYMYYYIDIDPSAPYQFFRLFSDKAGVPKDDGGENDRDLIQYSMLILTSADAPVYNPPYKRQTYRVGDGTTVIRAIDFDADPFYDLNPDQEQWNVRTDMAEVKGPQTEAGTSGFGGNIGWIEPGEWVQYSVRFDMDGKYNIKAYLASKADNPGNVAVYVDDKLAGESDNVAYEDWQAYQWYNVGEISIAAGSRVIKTEFPSGGLNIAAIEITRVGDMEAQADEAAPAAEEPAEAAGGETPEEGGETPAANNNNADDGKDDGESGGSMIIIIIIGAVVLVVIIVVLVIVTKKKKA